MLTFKKVSLFLLALLLVVSFAACTGGETGEEPIEEPPYEENGDDGYAIPVPPIGEIEDSDLDGIHAVIVDGVGIPGSSFEMIGEDAIFPTHVGLMAIEQALGADVFWNMQTGEVSLMSPNGFITFMVGSTDFYIDGEPITLAEESVRIGDEIYVPIPFFRDVFGAGSAYFEGGNVFIGMDGSDMQ